MVHGVTNPPTFPDSKIPISQNSKSNARAGTIPHSLEASNYSLDFFFLGGGLI